MKRTLFISNFKKLLSVIVVVTITLFMISKLTFLLSDKESYRNYSSFLEDDLDYDVLFVGSSHVRYGFYPMELWEDHGITSYNLAGDANTLPVDYWLIKQAFHYNIPKVVVLDVYDNTPNSVVGGWEFVHYSTNVFPISLDKIKMVRDLGRNPEWKDNLGNPASERWDLVFPIAEYHDRWAKLIDPDYSAYKDWVEQSAIRKGAKPLTDIVEREEKTYPEVIDAEYDVIAQEYLEKTIELCQEEGCRVILVNTGYDCNDAAKLFADSVPEIADKYGLEYIDFTAMDVIDFSCDLQTTGWNTHVNASGGQKLTDYIGEVLSDDYGMQDHKDDPSCRKFHDDHDKYTDYIDQLIRGTSSLDEYLELMYGRDFNVTIDISDEGILQDGFVIPMMINLGIDVDKISSGTEITIDSEGNVSYCQASDEFEGKAKVTVFDVNRQFTVDEKEF